MARMVPYRAGRTVARIPRGYYGWGRLVASTAWRNRATIGRWARTYNRKRKSALKYRAAKRARFSRKQFGDRIGTTTAKHYIADQLLTPTGLASRTLANFAITDLPHTTSNAANMRQRNLVNMRGVKVCWEIRNLQTFPMYFHWAIVVPKKEDGITATDFFRDPYGSSRGVVFDSALTGIELDCNNINSDRFTIMCHKRYLLAPTTPTTFNENGNLNYRKFHRYQKIGRQFRYDNTGDSIAENGRAYVVYWCAPFMNQGTTGAPANQIQFTYRCITYFREPRV